LKIQRLFGLEGSILVCRVPSLWPSYIGERRTAFDKAYGINVRSYGEHVGNLMGTHWEPRKNGKNEKKIN
jgi:hypothetical protein